MTDESESSHELYAPNIQPSRIMHFALLYWAERDHFKIRVNELEAQRAAIPWKAIKQVCAWADTYLAPEGAGELDEVFEWVADNREGVQE